MNIVLNDKHIETKASTITLLIKELNLPTNGIAIAINNKLVPKDKWDSTTLTDGCNIVIITAVCGG